MRVNDLLVSSGRRGVAAVALGLAVLTGCDSLKPPEACDVSIAPLNITVGVNGTQQVVGTAFDCKGNTLKNKTTSYSSNNTLVATVTPTGLVVGVSVGQTQISASADGKTASAQVTVVPEAAATVTITPAPYVLRKTLMKQFTAVAKNSRGEIITGRTFQWSSSNSSIASVDDNGNVTGHAVGTVTIGAVTDGITGTAQVQITEIPLGSCSLTPANKKLTVTQTHQATLVLRDTANNVVSNTGRTMLWTSDNEVNATVTSSGVVTARKAGTAKITAAWNENTSVSCSFDVEAVDARIVSATIQQRNQTLRLNIPRQFSVQLLDSANNQIPLAGRNVQWKTVTPAIVTVSPSGLVTGISLGNGRVAVEAEGEVDTVNVTVTKVPVATVRLSPLQTSVVQGAQVNISATIEDSTGAQVTDRVVEWNSSDPVRASVIGNGNTATASTFGAGTVTITATSEGRNGTMQIVIQQVPADSVAVAPNAYTFGLSDANKSFSYTVLDASGNQLLGRTINVQSSDPSVAQVQGGSNVTSGTVNITAFKAGTTTFTLRALNALGQPEGKVTSVTVTITAPTPP